VVTQGCTGQTRIFKVGRGGTTYILPPNIGDNNVFFPWLSQKLGGNHWENIYIIAGEGWSELSLYYC
jgi:hypothetical protein